MIDARIVDSPAKSLKCVGKTERIISQIFVDLSFNRHAAMGTLRACQDTQSREAWPEPRHISSCKSPLYHDGVVSRPWQLWLSSGGLTLIRAASASG